MIYYHLNGDRMAQCWIFCDIRMAVKNMPIIYPWINMLKQGDFSKQVEKQVK